MYREKGRKVRREFYIEKDDLDERGYTRECGGCSSVFRGFARQPHNDMCRERLRAISKEGAKVRNAEGRKQDFEKKEIEKKRKKDEGKGEEQDKRTKTEVPQAGATGG